MATKTFVRRSKKDLQTPAVLPAPAAKEQEQATKPKDAAAGRDQDQASPAPSCDSPSAEDTLEIDSAWGGWRCLDRGHAARRSSMLMPVDGLLHALAQLQPYRQTKKQKDLRMKELRDLIFEMCDYFAEVDAFELAVESPEPEEKTAVKQNRKSKSKAKADVCARVLRLDATPSAEPLAVGEDRSPSSWGASPVSPHTDTPASAGPSSSTPQAGAAPEAVAQGSECGHASGGQDSRPAQGATPISAGSDASGAGLTPGSTDIDAAKMLANARRSSVLVPVALAAGRQSNILPLSHTAELPGRRSSIAPGGGVLEPVAGAGRRSSALPHVHEAVGMGRRSSVLPPVHQAAVSHAEEAEPSTAAEQDDDADAAFKSGRRSSVAGGKALGRHSSAMDRRSSAAGRRSSAATQHVQDEDAEINHRHEPDEQSTATTVAHVPGADSGAAESQAGTLDFRTMLHTLVEEEEQEEEDVEEEEEQEEDQVVTSARDEDTGVQEEEENEEEEAGAEAAEELTPLENLLKICGQSTQVGDIPSMEELISSQADIRKITKIGEGTYGEAFRYLKTVFKIVPIEGCQLVNGAAQKRADEMAAEALISLTLSRLREPGATGDASSKNVTGGFVQTYEVGVCRGPYAKELVKAWKKWDKTHGSENDPVDELPADQLFLVIAMMDSGRDLEKASMASFTQACSVLAQVAFTLAVAEEACEYEHRDMHWGNVLVRAADSSTTTYTLRGVPIQVHTHGMTVSLIDFTASRLRTPSGAIAYCDLSQDPELFEGPKGKIQFDTYRWMRKLVDDDWQSPCPATNCLWMAYLAEIMAAEKSATFTTAQKRQLREFRKRAAQAPSCCELVFDSMFKGLWVSKE